ncbi:MAG: site-specific integrase [Actinobacteria bacterium]|nr:site-specific integrase [Actinomycetota bacterium]
MSIQKRTSSTGKTSYYVRAHVGGGQYVGVGTYYNKKDAQAAEEEAKRDLRMGRPLSVKRIGFTEFAEDWLKTLTVKPSTQEDYRNTCRHLTDFFGKKDLQSIGTKDCERFVAQFSATHGARTTRKAVTRLRQIFRRAVAWGYLYTSPADNIGNLPKPRPSGKLALEPEQVRSLHDAMPDYWQPLVYVAVRTGLRSAEIFGLRWSDILWDQNQIHVQWQMARTGELAEPKSEAAKRRIDVTDELLAVLQTHRAACPDTTQDLVFPTPAGRAVHPGNFHRSVWKPARDKAGMPDVRLHDMRHTFGSLLIHSGRQIKYVQTVMGHASAQQTLDVYAHLMEGGGIGAAEELERALN